MQGQLSVMNAQLLEMRSGSADTKIVAEAAGKTAEATAQSVATAQRSLEVSMRPWVDISGTMLQSDIVPDVLPLFETHLKNVGKTPAQNVTAYFAVEVLKKCVCSPSSQKEAFGSIGPGAQRDITANMKPFPVDVVEQVRQRSLTVNLCVEILYEDDFSKHRRTTANLYYSPHENRKFSICPSGNTME
jgi:hypothetical protein